MDLLTLYAVAVVGYWIFESLRGDIGSSAPSPQPAAPPPPLPSKPFVQPPAPSRARYSSVEECFRSEYVSFSRLKSYSACPRRFRYAYLDGLVGSQSFVYTGEGETFHQACEQLLRSRIGQPLPDPDSSDVAQIFGHYKNRYRFIWKSLSKEARVLAVEHELRFKVRDSTFYGIVDLVLRDPDGVTHLVDYKTGQTPLAFVEQLELYCLPVLLSGAEERVRLSFLFVDSKEHIQWEVGPAHREEVVSNIFRVVDHMLGDRDFPARVSSRCRDCGFYSHCPDGQAGGSTAEIRWPTLTTAKRGAARRRKLKERAANAQIRRQTKRTANPRYLFVTVARAQYRCEETGQTIEVGEQHFASKNGRRLSRAGFRIRYPGCPYPEQTKQQKYPSK